VSTNLIKQISRRDFKKNPGHVCLVSASYVMYRCSLPSLDTEQKYDMHFIQHGAVTKIKQGDQFLKIDLVPTEISRRCSRNLSIAQFAPPVLGDYRTAIE